jgi:biotin carboxyl carrier protein
MTDSRLRALTGTVEREVTVGADGAFTIAGEAFQADPIGPGAWRVTCRGRSRVVHVARDGDEEAYWVHVDGRVHRVEITRAGVRPRRKTSGREHALAAPMPATVLSVIAEIGQPVNAGDTLLMLEAMKMELPVRAPRAGVVTAVHCREGEMVQPGVVLIDIT